MPMLSITDSEFNQFRRFIFEATGISMANGKQALVSGRLARRLAHLQLGSYGEYIELLDSGADAAEHQIAVDLLTTNETYFFREPRHFAALRSSAQAWREAGRCEAPFRVWSAACSSGEEPYSIAMTLSDVLAERPWELVGSDISSRVLARARSGHYQMERLERMPPEYLKRFCLKGQGPQTGTMLIEKALRRRVQFMQVNLNQELPPLGMFDVIFLRNVMIYFNLETKRQVVARILSHLKPGGYLYVGHSETLNEISSAVKPLAPSIYRKA
ncbi:CheR family methyltransferase [Pseudoduganella sp. OTU4001]|uniref:CheR family methyltransferase n=1 Tax=Pseudoduganella sp. OTU4001 TaxID=3043854 RepID=UPI00313C2555